MHSRVKFAGGFTKTGAIRSVTAIVRLHCAVFPQASVAVQVRVTLYACGQFPGVVASKNVMTGARSQRSVAVAAGNIGMAGQAIVAVTVGQPMIGAELSVTAMVWLH